jgi:hypothetical protein
MNDSEHHVAMLVSRVGRTRSRSPQSVRLGGPHCNRVLATSSGERAIIDPHGVEHSHASIEIGAV